MMPTQRLRQFFRVSGVLCGLVLLCQFPDAWNSASQAQLSNLFIFLQDQEPFYSPSTKTMKVGEMVEWFNRSATEHTITHDGCGGRQGCAFHSGHLHPGERFPVPRLEPGRYAYHCEIHPFMRGLLVVKPSLPEFNPTEL